MVHTEMTMAQQIARAAGDSQKQRTGLAPGEVTVALSNQTLVITLDGALSAAEQALARTAAGLAQLREYHRQLFAASATSLLRDIKRITGVDVREAAAADETSDGAIAQIFPTGTMVQVFLLKQAIPASEWNRLERITQP